MKTDKGKLVVISAPSGAGKGTVIKELMKFDPNLKLSVSATTRKPRPGEVDGVAYHFISHEHFQDMISNNEFLEYAQYIDEYYGTPIRLINENIDTGITVLLEIDVQGAKQIKMKKPDAISIFIMAPSMEELENRLRGRGTDSEEKLIARLKRAKQELIESSFYDHTVINDDPKRAANEMLTFIK